MLFCMTPQERTDSVLAEVRAEMARQGVNLTWLAETSGLNASSLSRKMRGETPMLLIELLTLCEALHVTVPVLLRRIEDMAAA